MNIFSLRNFCLFISVFLFLNWPLHAAVGIESWKTKNGAKVFFVETHTIPVLDVRVDFDAGSRRDPKGKSGVAFLTNLMLSKGVSASKHPLNEPALTEAQIADVFADVGAIDSEDMSADKAGVSLRTLSSEKESDKAIRMLARLFSQPSFPADLLKRDKMRSISAIRETLTQPGSIASRTFLKEIYGNHPYGLSPTPESLNSISRKDLHDFHQTYYVADSATITIVGDASRSRAEKIAEELSMRLNSSFNKYRKSDLPEVVNGINKTKIVEHPSTQSHILIGLPALKKGDPDFFPLVVGNYVLGGGGFVSRLMQEIREKRGFSYSIYSQFDSRIQEGPFIISLQTKKEQTKDAIQVVKETFDAFMQNGPTEEEVKAAKDNLIKGFPLRMDNNRKILSLVSMVGYYDLPLDYLDTWTNHVNAVTVKDVREAFARKISTDKLTTVIIGESK